MWPTVGHNITKLNPLPPALWPENGGAEGTSIGNAEDLGYKGADYMRGGDLQQPLRAI